MRMWGRLSSSKARLVFKIFKYNLHNGRVGIRLRYGWTGKACESVADVYNRVDLPNVVPSQNRCHKDLG